MAPSAFMRVVAFLIVSFGLVSSSSAAASATTSCSAPAHTCPPTLIANGGFETGVNPWTFNEYSGLGKGGPNYARTGSAYAQISFNLEVEEDYGFGFGSFAQLATGVCSNTAYTVKGYYATEGDPTGASCYWFVKTIDSSGAWSGANEGLLYRSSTGLARTYAANSLPVYVPFNFSYISAADVSSVGFKFHVVCLSESTNTQPFSMFFDDIQVSANMPSVCNPAVGQPTSKPIAAQVAGAFTTSTVYSTQTYTKFRCPSYVKDCSYATVIRKAFPLYTTVYPVTEFPAPSAVSSTIPNIQTTKIDSISSSVTASSSTNPAYPSMLLTASNPPAASVKSEVLSSSAMSLTATPLKAGNTAIRGAIALSVVIIAFVV